MPCVDIREAICKFLDDIVCFSTYCITRTFLSPRHAKTSSPFFAGGEEVSPCICFQGEGLHQAGLRAHGLIYSPGSRLLLIDRLPRLNATLD